MSAGKGNSKKEGLVCKGTCLTCKVTGPCSEVDWNSKIQLLTGARENNKSIYWGKVVLMDTPGGH